MKQLIEESFKYVAVIEHHVKQGRYDLVAHRVWTDPQYATINPDLTSYPSSTLKAGESSSAAAATPQEPTNPTVPSITNPLTGFNLSGKHSTSISLTDGAGLSSTMKTNATADWHGNEEQPKDQPPSSSAVQGVPPPPGPATAVSLPLPPPPPPPTALAPAASGSTSVPPPPPPIASTTPAPASALNLNSNPELTAASRGTFDAIILPELWDTVVEPGMCISMHMWPLPAASAPVPAPPPPPPPAAPLPHPPPPPGMGRGRGGGGMPPRGRGRGGAGMAGGGRGVVNGNINGPPGPGGPPPPGFPLPLPPLVSVGAPPPPMWVNTASSSSFFGRGASTAKPRGKTRKKQEH